MKGPLLAVDDNVEFLTLLSEKLASQGYQVEEAQDIQEALAAMTARAFDVALLDLQLAHESGIELIEKLKGISQATEIVMMSGQASVAAAVEAMRRGAFDFLEKPLDMKRLALILDRAFDRVLLARENAALRSHLASQNDPKVARVPPSLLSPAMRRLYEDIERVAARDVPVLILGESGVGKELVARALHERSGRSASPWMPVNCGALEPSLADSDLFGHEKGAFTGAHDRKLGLVEVARGGTLFLDEVGELSLEVQAKLLRFLDQGEFRRVGGSQVQYATTRVVAATNRDLGVATGAGRFREDLFFRLSAVTLRVPPLRERRGEIPAFVRHFLAQRGEARPLSEEALLALVEREWRGNLRELRNAVDQLLLRGDPSRLTAKDVMALGAMGPSSPEPGRTPVELESFSLALAERKLIERALDHFGWNQTHAARALGLSLRTLYRRIQDLGLRKKNGGGP
jgi:DNA-binding NtrC family response regulator